MHLPHRMNSGPLRSLRHLRNAAQETASILAVAPSLKSRIPFSITSSISRRDADVRRMHDRHTWCR